MPRIIASRDDTGADYEDDDASLGIKACCSYPHGTVSVFAGALAIFSWAITWTASGTCHFVQVDLGEQLVDNDITGFPSTREEEDQWLSFGLFVHEKYMDDYCTDYSSYQQDVLFDAKWRTARAFSGMADFFGFCVMVFTVLMACMATHPKFIRNLALACVLIGFLSIMMLVGLASQICKDMYECHLGRGTIYSIIGTTTWFMTAVCVAKIPPPKMREDGDGEEQRPINLNFQQELGSNGGGDATTPPEVEMAKKLPPGTVTQTETILPDGTVTHLVTTVNKDGTQTETKTPKPENEIV